MVREEEAEVEERGVLPDRLEGDHLVEVSIMRQVATILVKSRDISSMQWRDQRIDLCSSSSSSSSSSSIRIGFPTGRQPSRLPTLPRHLRT